MPLLWPEADRFQQSKSFAKRLPDATAIATNQEPKLPAYGVVNPHSSVKLNQWATTFVEVDNLFDRIYYTYSTFTQLDNLLPGVNLSDSRTLSPSPGRVAYAGIRVTF
jgi:iron complex outermembrane recepter protein